MTPTRIHIAVAALAVAAPLAAQSRPAITGISHIAVYASDPAAAEHFYAGELGAAKESDPENPQGTVYRLSEQQYVEVLPLPSGAGIQRMDHVAFLTANAAALHDYLGAHGYKATEAVTTETDGTKHFFTRDPEDNRVEFVQPAPHTVQALAELVSPRIIHVGYMVKNRAAEDRFYRELLGFRPYWYGAMKPDKVDWVSEQVPDGHDWLEYMMAGPGSDTPDAAKVDARQLGVLDHVSLGVPNMEKAVTALYADDRIRFSPRHDGPQMGKDGKWQANLYDPDGTRVELMEFQPVIKPCCSSFTAESPAE